MTAVELLVRLAVVKTNLPDQSRSAQLESGGLCQNWPQQEADAEIISLTVLFYTAAKEVSSTRVRAV